ncbi:MAG: glycyl-radical enzyme activating protein [Omnitrophica WOR_2 bacterium]
MDQTGIVFNIQRFSIHDGPGIRTTVFLKGCSLHCFWCHNPEGIHLKPEIQFYPGRCIADGECVQACSENAHEFIDGQHIFLRERCSACGDCVDVCYTNALELDGKTLTVDQVMQEILADRSFYESSGGGVTLSGGDPLVQRGFTRAILARCRQDGIHTAIETTSNCRWEHLAELLPLTDLVMMDIKQMDPVKHRQATGVSNARLLANARRLAQAGVPLILRTPVIPGVNDTPQDIAAIAAFIRELVELGRENGHYAAAPFLELLPFHRLAEDKYNSLGMEYRVRHLQPPTREKMDELVEVAVSQGISARHR